MVAALTGGAVTSAVNVPAIPPEDMEVLGPFVPLCRALGRIAVALAEGSSIDDVRTEFLGRVAERDTRLLSIEVLLGVLRGHTEEEVGVVNAPAMAEERGIAVAETKSTTARDYTDLIRVTVVCGEERGAGRRHADRPAQPPAPARGLGPAVRHPARGHITLLRYRDGPGMIGRVGTIFGEHRLNIVSAAVGRQPAGGQDDGRGLAAMAITTDVPVPPEVVEEIVAGDGFVPVTPSRTSERRWRSGARRGRLQAAMRAVVITRARRARGAPGPGAAGPGPGKPDEVLIDVAAAGINFADTMARVGLYPDAPKPPASSATRWRERWRRSAPRPRTGSESGERVAAPTRFGGYAERAVAAADGVVPMPEGMSFEQGAAIPINYATAWEALIRQANLQPGERVLIHAAAGGVGIAATQIAKRARRRGVGDGIAGQARRDPRVRRRAPDRLHATAGSGTFRGSTS